MAVYLSVQHWRHYLLTQTTIVYTDHSALIQLINLKEATGKFARMQVFLSEFDLIIKHRPGTHNVVPDALSRLDTEEPTILVLEHELDEKEQKEFSQVIYFLKTASFSEKCLARTTKCKEASSQIPTNQWNPTPTC